MQKESTKKFSVRLIAITEHIKNKLYTTIENNLLLDTFIKAHTPYRINVRNDEAKTSIIPGNK